jgi:poly(3-hydroxybutyrate) depolymerase
MLERNGISRDVPANARLAPGSTGITEVVVQLFEGEAAFLMATVINGGHNWPTPATRGNPPVAEHFDATATIVTFWQLHAGLPN